MTLFLDFQINNQGTNNPRWGVLKKATEQEVSSTLTKKVRKVLLPHCRNLQQPLPSTLFLDPKSIKALDTGCSREQQNKSEQVRTSQNSELRIQNPAFLTHTQQKKQEKNVYFRPLTPPPSMNECEAFFFFHFFSSNGGGSRASFDRSKNSSTSLTASTFSTRSGSLDLRSLFGGASGRGGGGVGAKREGG